MMPTESARLLESARRFVRQDSRHDLNPGYRTVLYEQMGLLLDIDEIESPATDMRGYQRRMTLALHTTRQIAPLWEAKYASIRRPFANLALAEEIFRRTIAHQWTATENDTLSGELIPDLASSMQEVYLSSIRDPLLGFDYAAYTTLAIAFSDHLSVLVQAGDDEDGDSEYFPVRELDIPEQQILYVYKDVASWAAMAAADGPAEWPDSNAQKRLVFWEWWLTEAVPSVWEALPDEAG